jgi:hypothetical protein
MSSDIDEDVIDPAVASDRWPKIIELKFPIEFGKVTITELQMRRGRLGDLKGVKLVTEIPTDHLIMIASRMCGQPVGVIERLDQDDSGEVMAVALDFYARSLTGGKTR